jgi:TolB-like protein
MEKYKLDLIGAFGMFTPEGDRIEITSKKAVALIALIATAPSGERSRRWLQGMLWGASEETRAQASLRRELSSLAKLLDAHGAGALLLRSSQRVGLDIEQLDIDFFSLGISLPIGRPRSSGVFLEGLDLKDCEEFEEWLRDERERVRDTMAVDIPEPGPLPSAQDILGMDLPSAQDLLSGAPLRLPPKPSVAVMPFDELTSDGGGWLGLGVADEIGVILSQFPQLFIVASASTRALAEQKVPRREIARRLGVRYLLDGTVMPLGERLRVSVSLVEGDTGEQVWAETFNSKMDEIFDMQAEIASRITPQIWSKVDLSERRRGLRSAGPSLDSYETYWRANALFRSWEKEPVFEAIELIEALTASDPTCPWAASLAAYCHSIAYALGFSKDRKASLHRAILHYQAAIRHGEDNVEALGYCAGTLINIGGDLDVADRLIAHALNLLPAHQPALFWGGWVDIFRGNAARARERFELALRINPATGVRAQTLCGIGFAALQQGEAQAAYNFLLEASQTGPGFILSHIGLTMAATLVGKVDVAEAAARTLSRSSAALDLISIFRKPEDRALFATIIRQTGAPLQAMTGFDIDTPTFALPH